MNTFEAVARAKKVAKLVSVVPAPETRSQAERLATLAGFTDRQRAAWAQAAGVRAPSETTWAWLCSAVREARV